MVRGGPDTLGQWPTELDALPANLKILRRGETGSGQVVEDNRADIDQVVAAYNDSLPTPPKRPEAQGDAGNGGGGNDSDDDNGGDGSDNDSGAADWVATPAGGCSCHLGARSTIPDLAVGLGGALLALGRVRRRRALRR